MMGIVDEQGDRLAAAGMLRQCAQQALAQTRLALRQNQVALYKALGGGWADQAPETD